MYTRFTSPPTSDADTSKKRPLVDGSTTAIDRRSGDVGWVRIAVVHLRFHPCVQSLDARLRGARRRFDFGASELADGEQELLLGTTVGLEAPNGGKLCRERPVEVLRTRLTEVGGCLEEHRIELVDVLRRQPGDQAPRAPEPGRVMSRVNSGWIGRPLTSSVLPSTV